MNILGFEHLFMADYDVESRYEMEMYTYSYRVLTTFLSSLPYISETKQFLYKILSD